jgi:hypothetical protein
MLDHAHLSRKVSTPILGAVVALALLAAACTKTEGQTSGTAATGTPSSSASAATAAPDASPIAADTTTGNSPTGGADATAPAPSASAASAVTATASGGVAPATSASASAASADGAGTCGKKPLPDCPLQGWMKSNTNPAIASQDFPGLATALDKVATFAPPGYTNWASIAKDGAKAARASDMTATKASCRTCHDQYKDKYKKELRTRKI